MPYLIDGHNVIAALHDIDLDDPHDEAKLVMKLRAWAARIRRKAIVVFDGGIPGGPSPTLSTTDVKVVFAARHHTNADRVIHERLSSLPDTPNWTVVSSDHEVLDRARAIGARTLTAQQFADELERPTRPEAEKPESASPAEVLAWLEVFQEVEETEEAKEPGAPQAVAPPSAASRPSKGRRRRPPVPGPNVAEPRHARSIAEQMGMTLKPAPKAPKPVNKPGYVSSDEVDSWLEVFHDDPNSQVPPPDLPPRQPSTKRPQEPVVRKGGALTSSEVETWLTVFGEDASEQTEPPKSDERRPSEASSRLAKHRRRTAQIDGETPSDTSESSLSDEDRELWQRLFGKGE